MAEDKMPPEPKIQESQTKSQKLQVGAGWECGIQGLPKVASDIKLYRRMRNNPTFALARALSYAPIRSAGWAYEVRDDVTDEQLAFIRSQMDPKKDHLMANLLYGLDYGYQAFEKVWEYVDGKWCLKKLKPLLPEYTEPLVDETGRFQGLKNQGVELTPEYVLWFTHEKEGDNYKGRARSENCKIPYLAWEELVDKEMMYIKKVAGVLPIIEYPEGTGKDANGQEVDNFRLAMAVLDALGKGRGVVMPNTLIQYAQDLIVRGITTKDLLRAWNITFLEATGQHGTQFVEQMKHKESLIMRGWFQPERTATEGQFGTKAESQTHADIALVMAEFALRDMLACVNAYVVNPLLVYNFGPQFKDAVRIVGEKLNDEVANMIRSTMQQVFTNNPDMLTAFTDFDAVMDLSGWPKRESVIDPENPSVEDEDKDDADEEVAGEAETDRRLAGFHSTLQRIRASMRRVTIR